MAEEKFVSFDQLDDAAQQKVVSDFAKFYVPHFKAKNLDILTQDDHNGDVVDINSYLNNNATFSPEELLDGVITNRAGSFKRLLTYITDQQYAQDGSSVATPWEEWYLQKTVNIPQDRG
ncbi:hypothetical protein [Lactobacillus selangorensis]|nr:hypothetical protein [Lactobacillus selangorensis]